MRLTLAAALAAAWCEVARAGDAAPLRVAVGDPLALENACACVAGFAQRDYHRLAGALSGELGRPVEVAFASTLEQARERLGGEPHLLIGKASVVEAQLARAGQAAPACLARLSDRDGRLTLQGVWVVRADDKARRASELAGHRLLLGPAECAEKHAAALELLRAFGVEAPAAPETCDACTQAARLVAAGPVPDDPRPVAAAVSDYALRLLVGCEAVEAGALRVVGRTAPVPFVAAYAAPALAPGEAGAVSRALLKVSRSSRLRRALESRDGFVSAEALPAESGLPGEVALPERLPERPAVRWRRALSAQSLGGLAAADGRLFLSDRDAGDTNDVWRCLDAATGEPLWTLTYPAPGKMDYTGAPRATPVAAGGMVYLLGAFGDLVCAEAATGREAWRCNLLQRFGGKLPTWGFCGTPLVAGGRLVLQTASTKAAVVALDLQTGREIWRARGEGPGYGSLIHTFLGGRWQIVGHESRALCGWDPETGRRLWQVVPPEPHDFNVPTPLRVGDWLCAATENNGARLYAFDEGGVIRSEPAARSEALSPQMATPVLAGGRVWGQDDGVLCALSAGAGLAAAGQFEDVALKDYASLLAGAGRVLAVAKTGDLFLFDARSAGLEPLSRSRVFESRSGCETEVWSRPAVAGGCIYLRSQDEVVCASLSGGL